MKDIFDRIEEMQRGKQGIYPYHVARDIACEFQVPMNQAMDCVIAHIRTELYEAARKDADTDTERMKAGFGEALDLTRKATE